MTPDTDARQTLAMEYALCSFEVHHFSNEQGVPAEELHVVRIECKVLDELRGLEQVIKDVPFARVSPIVTAASITRKSPPIASVDGPDISGPVDRLKVFDSLSDAGFSLVSQSSSSSRIKYVDVDKYTFQRGSTALGKRRRPS